MDKPEVAAASAPCERVQATLSVIGDVSVAASEAMKRPRAPLRPAAWRAALVFLALAYAGGAAWAWLLLPAAELSTVALLPLLPVLCAAGAFWWGRRWKLRAADETLRLKASEEALNSLGHAAANSANAVRANLISFRLSTPEAAPSEHLNEVELAARRLDTALRRAQSSRDRSASA